MSKQEQTFSCLNCGQAYSVYPPDSSFKNAYVSPCQESSSSPNHNLKTGYDCQNCDKRNELYWCQGHRHTVSSKKPSIDDIRPPSFRKNRVRGF